MMLASILLELTWREIVTDIPHDFAAFVVYTLVALFIAGIWYGSRGKPTDGAGGTDARAPEA